MPIFRIDTKLIYFAHVPKCGGSAVEDYLEARFGTLGFLNRAHLSVPENQRWTRTSPQHIHANAMDRLMPPSFFAARFAVVRHPVKRLVSVFRFQRDIHRDIPATMGFSDWLSGLQQRRRNNPFYLDNHCRPMVDLVPEDATVFRLEDGLNNVVAWLDELAGDNSEPREIERTNTYLQRLKRQKLSRGPELRVTGRVRRQIEDYCAADFERFGYDRVAV